jgi:hypothetical protein
VVNEQFYIVDASVFPISLNKGFVGILSADWVGFSYLNQDWQISSYGLGWWAKELK